MARPHRPSYHAPRGCWKVQHDGRTHYFGRDIARDEKPRYEGIPKRAWEAMEALLARLRAGAGRLEAVPDALTLRQLARRHLRWLKGEVDEGRVELSTFEGRRAHLAVLCAAGRPGEPPLGDRPVGRLEPHDLVVALSTWEQPRSESDPRPRYGVHYRRNLCRSAQALLNWATRKRSGVALIAENPFRGVQPPRLPQAPNRYLDSATLRRFVRWAWARARWRPYPPDRRFDRLFLALFQLCALTGCRPGEAIRLRWEWVRWAEGRAVIPPRQWKSGRKTGRERVIILTPPAARLLAAIRRHPDAHPEHVFTHRPGPGSAPRTEAERRRGEPWADSSVAGNKLRRLRKAAIAAGHALDDCGPRRIVGYLPRHLYASDALMGGLTHEETAELMGTSAVQIAGTYGHLQVEHLQQRALEVLQARRKLKVGEAREVT